MGLHTAILYVSELLLAAAGICWALFFDNTEIPIPGNAGRILELRRRHRLVNAGGRLGWAVRWEFKGWRHLLILAIGAALLLGIIRAAGK